MSNWAHFRKHWIKPEVYPLLGAMGAALGVCAAALINKARDPTIGWNKSKRSEGQDALLEGVDEVVPLWSKSSKNSTRIFGHDKSIVESKFKHTTIPEIAVVKAEEAEEEEEEEADSIAEEVAEELTVAVSTPVVEIIDEAPEKIEAAVEAATHSIQETANSAKEVTPSIEEVKQSVEDAIKSVSGSAENAASSVTEDTKSASS